MTNQTPRDSAQLPDAFDARDFYELMQAYRNAPFADIGAVVAAFEAVKDYAREALRAQAASVEPVARKIDLGFRWDCEAQHHVPTLLLEFEPVPSGMPNDAKGWRDRNATALALRYPPAHIPADAEAKRDREADRVKYPDVNFQRWLDESITENGEFTAWHALKSVGDAFAGWSVRPDYEAEQADKRSDSLRFLNHALKLADRLTDTEISYTLRLYLAGAHAPQPQAVAASSPATADEREAFEDWAIEQPRVASEEDCFARSPYGARPYEYGAVQSLWLAWQARAALAARSGQVAASAMVALTKDQMEKGREQIFSVNNPYCPCDSKTFRKVAEWVEAHHGIGLTVGGSNGGGA